MTQYFDVIGVGFGPSNIALAVALEESSWRGSLMFLEKNRKAAWQPNMMLPGSDIQNNPLRDLVTPRNPRSKYSFTNYLFENELLFEYLNLGLVFPEREEFGRYIEWVANQFQSNVKYDCSVRSINIEYIGDGYKYVVHDDEGCRYVSSALVVAPGRTPNIPEIFTNDLGSNIFHLNEYLEKITTIANKTPEAKVAVVGGSQSAIEIVLHLSKKYPSLEVTNFLRTFGYRLKDTSPFSERVYFPEHIDFYYHLADKDKQNLNGQLRQTNYSVADADVIHELNLLLYRQRSQRSDNVKLITLSDIKKVCKVDDGVVLTHSERYEKNTTDTRFDCVVLATGFKDVGSTITARDCPSLLKDIVGTPPFSRAVGTKILRNYSLESDDKYETSPPLYLNGLCESSHGMGDAGSFSLVSMRSGDICSSLIRFFSDRRMRAMESQRPPSDGSHVSSANGAVVQL